jgi:uncharacterized repeat protein (TIGR01451 family)
MRRALLALLAAAGVATLIAVPAGPAAGLLGAQADLTVTSAGRPDAVAPPGGNVEYRVTATNNGPLPSALVDFTDTVSGGGTILAGESEIPAGCTTTATTVSCNDLLLASGAPRAFRIVVKTSAVGTVVNTATISSAVAGLDEIPGNNSATTSTPVTENSNGSHALVLGGECISFELSSLCVPEEVEGVFVKLADSDLSNSPQCGTTGCGVGLHVDFLQDDKYKAEDPNHPLVVDMSFGKQGGNCQSTSDKCSTIYVRKSFDGPVTPLPACDPTLATPCEFDRFKDATVDGSPIHWIVHMLSNDPDLLKQLSGSL